MRLLLLTPEFRGSGGGIITYYRSLTPALVRAGVEVSVIQGSPQCTANESESGSIDGVHVQTLERRRFDKWRERFRSYAAAPTLRNSLAAAWAMWEQAGHGQGFDIVEACDWGLSFVPPVVEASLPVLLQFHGSAGQIAVHDCIEGEEIDGKLIRMIERAAAGSATGLQTCSEANAAFWHSETGRHVDVQRPAWRHATTDSNVSVADRALIVGRLQRWKGPHILATALRQLRTHRLTVDWYGRDVNWNRHETTSMYMARSFPDLWGNAIIHHASVPPAEVTRLQASAKFNLVPSPWDVFNLTVAEAMASGRPVICSDGAGASEMIVDGETGYVFSKNDPAALAATLERALLEDDRRLREMGVAAQDVVRRLLDPEHIATARIATYEDTIRKFHASPKEFAKGWLSEACSPDGAFHQEFAFLESVPLRSLISHMRSRLRRKIGEYLPTGVIQRSNILQGFPAATPASGSSATGLADHQRATAPHSPSRTETVREAVAATRPAQVVE